jgi:cAMP phosphodiesterase
VKLQLLPSTFESGGAASKRQHLTTLVLDDTVAFDAGSLAMACSDEQKASIRDVIISHAHLDHVAGLPLFIDDLFATLTEPIRIHATPEVIEVLEEHIFNWKIYPRFSELANESGPVVEYVEFRPGSRFDVRGLTIVPIEVDHKVQSCGFIISDDQTTIAVTGDTAPTDGFWESVNKLPSLQAVLIECAFPNELAELASHSFHMTPNELGNELKKLERSDCEILVMNIKPAYCGETVSQIRELNLERVRILEVGKIYEW